MKLQKGSGRAVVKSPGVSLILFRVAQFTLAIEASKVDEIRDSTGLHDLFLPAAAAKVRHSFVMHGVDYFVVDSDYHYRLLPSKAQNLLVLHGLPVAITAGSIERMCEAGAMKPLPAAFCGEELHWYKGLVVVDESVIPVVNPESFLDAAELEQLQRRAAMQRGGAE